MTKKISDALLVEASYASLRTGKTLVTVVTTDDNHQGEKYAAFMTREQMEAINRSGLLGDYLSFEIRKQDLGDC